MSPEQLFQKQLDGTLNGEKMSQEKYHDVKTVENVLVNLPKLTGPYVEPIPKHKLQDGTPIDKHYRQGQVVNSKPLVIMSKNFFDFSEDDFGKKRTATVLIQEKTTPKGIFSLITFTAENSTVSTSELKIVDEPRSGDDIPILNSSKFIHFKPITD